MVAAMSLDAIVVLGCRVGPDGQLSGAARRRVERAAAAFHAEGGPLVVTSGGKRWHGVAEANAFCAGLQALGVPRALLATELRSLSTRENARFSSMLLRRHGAARVGVVTCHWHMKRALAAFRHYGIDARPLPAIAPRPRWRRVSEPLQLALDRAWLRLERLGLFALLCALVALGACQSRTQAAAAAGPSASSSARVAPAPLGAASAAPSLRAVLASARLRRIDAVLQAALVARDATLREAALRALAQMDGAAASDALLSGLADESPRVAAQAAFGLGRSCAGHEAEFSRALTLRASALATLAPERSEAALRAIAQALARCGSDEAERTLRAWLKVPGRIAELAALALGDLAQRRGRLEEQTFVALLNAVPTGEAHLEHALAPFSRFVAPPSALRERLLALASAALTQGGTERELALRALGRAGASDALLALARAPVSDTATLSELVRELVRLGEAGQLGLAELLNGLLPDEGAARALLTSERAAALIAVLEGLEAAGPKTREALLRAARLESGAAEPWLARRAGLIRCAAARLLYKDPNDPELLRCDPEANGQSGKLARIAVLDRLELVGARADQLRALASDADPSVRQRALRLIPKHRELAAAPLLTHALTDEAPGVVATAAEILSAHPERAESAAAGAKPDAKLAAALAKALTSVSRADVSVRAALLDAVMGLKLLSSMSEVEKSCADPNPTLRRHAQRALAALGQPRRRCAAASDAQPQPEELNHLVSSTVRLLFDTDVGALELELEPSAAPLAVTRVVELAKSGFYDGLRVHRAIFGFAVQFGDPNGDGYGSGGHAPLFSELGPTPFVSGSVGLAQSGADTGSTQLFVTLGRFPHLDGESAYLGRAGPGWERLVVGDRIRSVKIQK